MMPKQRPIAALYARVSTADQSHDLQTTELREYATRMGFTWREYVEKASSVKKRPEFEQLMSDAKQRKVDVVIVWKLDRFARSISQLVESINSLDRAGVRFIAVTQSIDTDKQSAAGRLMMHMLGAFAEFERSLIVERVNAGIQEAKRKGKKCGRPKRVFDRSRALQLRAKGLGVRAIADQLGVSRMSVQRALAHALVLLLLVVWLAG
jgi:putative DNA-invertase from lambdoid prophage Rac